MLLSLFDFDRNSSAATCIKYNNDLFVPVGRQKNEALEFQLLSIHVQSYK